MLLYSTMKSKLNQTLIKREQVQNINLPKTGLFVICYERIRRDVIVGLISIWVCVQKISYPMIHQVFSLAHDWLNSSRSEFSNFACCKKYFKGNKYKHNLHLTFNICSDIFPVPWSSQFSSSFALAKLFLFRNRYSPRTNIRTCDHLKSNIQ